MNSRKIAVATALRETSFFKMPASTRWHSNHEGGLMEHSISVWLELENLTDRLGLQWSDPDSPYVIAMLHDACKIDAYFYNHEQRCWERRDDHPDGHGDLSLRVIDQLGIKLTAEERACIRWHMGAFDKTENWSKFTEAMKEYPNVFWTHVADMTSTHFVESDRVKESKVCCICGARIEGYGNNPYPVSVDTNSVCCDMCNMAKVIPARLKQVKEDNNEE